GLCTSDDQGASLAQEASDRRQPQSYSCVSLSLFFFSAGHLRAKPEFILARGTTLGLATSHPHFSGSYCRLLCLFRGVKRAVGIVSFTLFADAGADVNCVKTSHPTAVIELI